MNLPRLFLICAALSLTLHGQEPRTLKEVHDRSQRGTLSDQRQILRGDTGKWNDAAMLLHAPSSVRKPQGMPLDDWMDELSENKTAPASVADENWLLFRTRQLDDNDRVWIEKIERAGNAFTITMHEAVWQGSYFKTFTYYEVDAVNLGKLPPGDYTVTWIVKPLAFKQLEKPREAQRDYQTNWPLDEQPGAGTPVEVSARFTVTGQ